MKEVASEKEAMDEIKRYLEVNELQMTWVTIKHERRFDQNNSSVAEEYKTVEAGLVGCCENFIIRYSTMPPYLHIDEIKSSFINESEMRPCAWFYCFSMRHEAIWADEFRRYTQDLQQRLKEV